MLLDALRRRRVPLGITLLAIAVWLLAGLRWIGGEEGTRAVLDSPVGLLTPRIAAPGWHLAPPGLVRVTAYPGTSRTYDFQAGDKDGPLVTRDGLGLVASGTIRYRVDPDRLLEVHRSLGPSLESTSIGPWVTAVLSAAVKEASYGDVSGARKEDLSSEVGQALAERFRANGLVLLSCDVGSVGIRAGGARPGVARARVSGLKVLLVGLDGADWNILDPLIQAGKMPNLARLVRTGVRGRLRTISPVLSPVVWTSIATGVLPGRHGIIDFLATTDRPGERIPVTSSQRKVKAIWNILSESGLSVGIAGWWATYPAETVDGFIVSDRIAYQLFKSRATGDQPREGRVFPAAQDDLVRSLTVVPETLNLEDLSPYMRLGSDPSTLSGEQIKLIEDFKTLLAAGDTYYKVSLSLGQKLRPDFQAFYLEGTDTVAHLFMPYAPPARAGVDGEAARRFGRTVEEYYRHADDLAGRLIEALRPTTVVVCSDHGFRTGENRPGTDSRIGYGQAADWHRKYGVVILSGPPFRKGVVLEEASVLDITPTILALFGLPIGEDMDGRPIAGAFEPAFLEEHPIVYVPTWEGEPMASGRSGILDGTHAPGPEHSDDPEGDAERREKLRSLGYLAQDTANSHNNQGLLLLSQGKFDEAVREFETAIAAEEDLNTVRLNLARAYFKKKDFRAATVALNEHLKRQPRSKEAENLLGNIAMDQGHMDEAEARFKRALEYEANYTDARNSLGILYDRLGRTADALREFSRVVAVDDDYAEAYNNIGVIHKNQGRIDDAIAAFQKAIAVDPEFSGSYSNLALVYEVRGDFKAAEDQFRAALRRDPENVAVRTNYGGLLYLQGRFEDARTELEKAVATDSRYASAHNNLGAVYGKLGRSSDEIAAYRKAIEIDPNYADVHHNFGLTLLKQGNFKEGETELRRSLTIDPRYGPAYLTLARHLLGRRQATAAVELLVRGVRELPKDAEIQSLLGEAYIRAGDTSRALAAFEASLALRPDQVELRRRLEALRGEGPAGDEKDRAPRDPGEDR
jgi:Tfp pilus assembly protein PilF